MNFLYNVSLFFISFFVVHTSVWAQKSPDLINFIENKGQWQQEVLFRTDIPGGKLYVLKDRLRYQFYDISFMTSHHGHGNHQKNHKEFKSISSTIIPVNPKPKNDSLRTHVFDVVFDQHDENISWEQQNYSITKYNYFLGNKIERWASNCSASKELIIHSLWEGVDMRIYEYNNSLKYEFILKAFVDPSIIKLKYIGLENIFIENEELKIFTSLNYFFEKKPFSYQPNLNNKEVVSSFHLDSNILSFDIGMYDKTKPLIIDPELIFSTYSGSTADNWGNTAAYDDQGNMYSGGSVFGVGFPTTTGAYNVSYNGIDAYGWGIDVGILKFNSIGTSLLYCTYIGGYLTDIPHSIVVNSKGELIILGTTSSVDFPVTANSYDNTFNGGTQFAALDGLNYYFGSDIFLFILSNDGSAYVGSTYLGGIDNDGVMYEGESLVKNYGDQLRGDVLVDSTDNIYLASYTKSLNFPIINGFQPTYAGGANDGIVAKVNTDASALVWSSFIGGNAQDAVYSIQLDTNYNVIIAGGTESSNFPTSTGVFDETYNGGIDGFVSIIDKDGTAILKSTYTGTNAYDQNYFVQTDNNGNIFLLGQTLGNYPISSNVYSNLNSGVFIHSLTPDLLSSRFSTTIGSGIGLPNISPTAFLVNECGTIMLSGWGGEINADYIGGNTFNMPISEFAYQKTTDGSDFYIMVLGKDANEFLFGTYLGDPNVDDHVDGGTSRFDKKGIIYQSVCGGCGGSSTFPTTPGAWSNTNNSFFQIGGVFYTNCNNVAFKYDLTNLNAGFDATPELICRQALVDITNKSLGGVTFEWDFGDGTDTTGFGPHQHYYDKVGDYTIKLIVTDLTTCLLKDTAEKIIKVLGFPEIKADFDHESVCYGDSIRITGPDNIAYAYTWYPDYNISTTKEFNPIVFPLVDTTYFLIVVDTIGCTDTAAVKIDVVNISGEILIEDITQCDGIPRLILTNNSIGANMQYVWDYGSSIKYNGNPITLTLPEMKDYEIHLFLDNIGTNCDVDLYKPISFNPIFIPNFVTPNGDGMNDTWNISGLTKGWEVEIYNRWGDPIYLNSNYQNEWNPNKLNDDTYYYIIKTISGEDCKGWIQVVR